MILIALSGGSAAERVSISDQLVASGKGQLSAYAQPTPGGDFNMRRVNMLRSVLEAPAADGAPPSAVAGLIITHTLTDEEAFEVRKRGGAVWHLYSKPSSAVMILSGDAIVAQKSGVPAHVLEPMEALSELMLKRTARAAADLSRLSAPGAVLTRAALARLVGRE